jgi:hypothetical protein
MMQANQGSEYGFFSVKHSCLIGGAQYRPSICYTIPQSLESTVKEMEKTGLARRYEYEMRFVSGVARPMPRKV